MSLIIRWAQHVKQQLLTQTDSNPNSTKSLLPPLMQVYNISGERFVTFAGLAKACAKAAGAPEPELVYYNPKEYDFGLDKKGKAKKVRVGLYVGGHALVGADLGDKGANLYGNAVCRWRGDGSGRTKLCHALACVTVSLQVSAPRSSAY